MMKTKDKKTKWNMIIIHFLCVLLFLISFSLIWSKRYYGNIGLDEIVFHLNMPFKGAADTVWLSMIKNIIVPTVLSEGIHILICKRFIIKNCFKNYKKIYLDIIVTWIIGLIILADVFFQLRVYISNHMQKSTLIEKEYINPKNIEIKFPEKKRNLICIYIESAETSMQNKKNGGVFEENFIPEMTEIAKENICFSQSTVIEGASIAPACGWTIAGLVAETAGVPLKLGSYGYSMDNMMGNYEEFLPGVVSLGDILESEGYRNYFMAGSDFSFGGRTEYFTQHGDYKIWDYYSAIEEKKIPEDYKVWWGFEDQKLYSYAKEKLLEISSENSPFNFSMLTVDTHQEDGYVCKLCEEEYDNQYANVWRCASKQLNMFIEWIKEQEFYENTTIVILGDHCSMDSDFFEKEEYNKHTGETERKVYNAFINSTINPLNCQNRLFTTMDMFPTILASMGVSIEGNQLGLGVNLFSEKETLSEEYGYKILFDELNRKSEYYNKELLYP